MESVSKYEFRITPQSDYKYYNLEYRLKTFFNLFNLWHSVPNASRIFPGEIVGCIYESYESAKKEAEYYFNNNNLLDLRIKKQTEEAEKNYLDHIKWVNSRNKSCIIK